MTDIERLKMQIALLNGATEGIAKSITTIRQIFQEQSQQMDILSLRIDVLSARLDADE